MKLVTMILTAMSLAACNVKGPEAGEAKGDEGQEEQQAETREVDEEYDVWGQVRFGDKIGANYFAYMLDFDKKQVLIREINEDGAFSDSPTSDRCTEHLDETHVSHSLDTGKMTYVAENARRTSGVVFTLDWDKDTGQWTHEISYDTRSSGRWVQGGKQFGGKEYTSVQVSSKDSIRSLLEEGKACVPRYYVNCMARKIRGVVAENGKYTCDAINTAWGNLTTWEKNQAIAQIEMDPENCAKDTEKDELCVDGLNNDNCCLIPPNDS